MFENLFSRLRQPQDMRWQGSRPVNETPFGKYNDLLGGRPNGRPTGRLDIQPRQYAIQGLQRSRIMPQTAQVPQMAAPGAPGQSPMSAPRRIGGFGLMRRFM